MYDGYLFFDILLFIAFTIFVIVFLYKKRKKLQVENKIFFLYRTKVGLKLMDKIAKKFPKALNILGIISIIVGYLGMAFGIFMFIAAIYQMAIMPKVPNVPPVMPLVPWLQLPGLPILYFSFWIIAIFIIASVHETAHGIFSRLYKVKVKSSGFGFVGPLPAAFVEPDEKQLQKKPVKQQIAMLSSGSFANLITAGIFLIILVAVISPAIIPPSLNSSIQIVSITKFSPAWNASLKEGDIIREMQIPERNLSSKNFLEFMNFSKELKPDENISLKIIEKSTKESKEINFLTAKSPTNSSAGIIGIGAQPYLETANLKILLWLFKLVQWLFLINLFVGIFNLLPVSIFDGGRIFYLTMLGFTKNQKKTIKIAKLVNIIFLLILAVIFIIWIIRI